MVEYEASPIPTKALKNKNAQKLLIKDPTKVAAAQRLRPKKKKDIYVVPKKIHSYIPQGLRLAFIQPIYQHFL